MDHTTSSKVSLRAFFHYIPLHQLLTCRAPWVHVGREVAVARGVHQEVPRTRPVVGHDPLGHQTQVGPGRVVAGLRNQVVGPAEATIEHK